MAYLLDVVLLLVLLSSLNANMAGDADNTNPQPSGGDTEGKAGEAINELLKEKISQKFKEAANEVKGVLVKQLGDSLKSAHAALVENKVQQVQKKVDNKVQKLENNLKQQYGDGNSIEGKAEEDDVNSVAPHQNNADRNRKNTGNVNAANTAATSPNAVNPAHHGHHKNAGHKNAGNAAQIVDGKPQGGPAIHQNKGPRHRKNGGAGAPPPTKELVEPINRTKKPPHITPFKETIDEVSGNLTKQNRASTPSPLKKLPLNSISEGVTKVKEDKQVLTPVQSQEPLPFDSISETLAEVQEKPAKQVPSSAPPKKIPPPPSKVQKVALKPQTQGPSLQPISSATCTPCSYGPSALNGNCCLPGDIAPPPPAAPQGSCPPSCAQTCGIRCAPPCCKGTKRNLLGQKMFRKRV